MFKNQKEQMVINDKQREIIEWMIAHGYHSALTTWKLLPNKYIALYDSLNPIQKADVELIVARHFAISVRKLGGKRNTNYEDLLYVEK